MRELLAFCAGVWLDALTYAATGEGEGSSSVGRFPGSFGFPS